MTGRPPCPLPVESLEAVLAPFGRSSLLPAAAYLDEAVFAWEQRHVHEGSWTCIGRLDDLHGAGAQRAVPVGSTSVLVTRSADGSVRAFANLCRHRGHELLPCGGATVRGVVQCPYHAWSYELDGRLRLAPRAGGDVDPAELGLLPVRLADWGGWWFVNLDGAAPPLDEHLGALPAILDAWDLDGLRVGVSHTYELAANWKLGAENYHECYHCPLIHPELCTVTHPASGDNLRDAAGAFVGGSMELKDHADTMSFSGRLVGTVRPRLSAVQRRQVVYVHVFPNLLVSAHPDYVMTHRFRPVSATRTEVVCEWAFDPVDLDRPGFDPSDAVELWDLTNRQDWAAVESVQRGIASPLYRPGVLAHDEDAVYQFLGMVANAYLGRPLVRGHVPTEYSRS